MVFAYQILCVIRVSKTMKCIAYSNESNRLVYVCDAYRQFAIPKKLNSKWMMACSCHIVHCYLNFVCSMDGWIDWRRLMIILDLLFYSFALHHQRATITPTMDAISFKMKERANKWANIFAQTSKYNWCRCFCCRCRYQPDQIRVPEIGWQNATIKWMRK